MKEPSSQLWGNTRNFIIFEIEGNLDMIKINLFILQMGSDEEHNLPENAYLKMTRTRT